MGDETDLAPTRVAVYLCRRSPRFFLEFLIARGLSGDQPVWLAPEADVPSGVSPAEIAATVAGRHAPPGRAVTLAPLNYRYPLPLWGSPDYQRHASPGCEEVFWGFTPGETSETATADDLRWVTVMDGVSILRYPEHVEALLRVSSSAESALSAQA